MRKIMVENVLYHEDEEGRWYYMVVGFRHYAKWRLEALLNHMCELYDQIAAKDIATSIEAVKGGGSWVSADVHARAITRIRELEEEMWKR